MKPVKSLISILLCLCILLSIAPAVLATDPWDDSIWGDNESGVEISSICLPVVHYAVEGDVAYVTGFEWEWHYIGSAYAPVKYDLEIASTYNSCPVVGIQDGALDMYYQNLEITVFIPASVTTVGSGAITGKSVKKAVFEGNAPVFHEEAFCEASMTVYCSHADAGWTEDVKQSYGGTSVKWSESVHIYSDVNVTVQPTCSSVGESIDTCSCGETRTSTIPVLPHTNVNNFCSICGADLRFTYTVLPSDPTTCRVNSCLEGQGVLEIPETIDGYTVTEINSNFKNAAGYSEIILPDTVTKICNSAFKNHTNLKKVTFGTNLVSVDWHAFEGCTSLETLVLGDSVERIENYAFAECTALREVTLGDGLKEIGWYAFENCTSLEALDLGSSVQTIGISAFSGCTKLKDVTLGNSVETLNWSVFSNCTSLETVTIGSGVQTIGNSCFSGCTGLSMVAFRGDAPEISDTAFKGVTAEMYYPSGNETYTDEVKVNYGGTLTWDHYCLKHTYEETVTTAPTCTEEGVKTLSCIYCDKVKTEAIPAAGHEFTDGVCHCGLSNISGDVTGDGKLNMGDVAKLYSAVKGSVELDETTAALADVNGDGKLNMGDVSKLFSQIRKK